MILFNIYLLMIAVLIGLAVIAYQKVWRPLQKLRVQTQEQERQLDEMRRREADLEARLRDAAMQELEQECGSVETHLGETFQSDRNQ